MPKILARWGKEDKKKCQTIYKGWVSLCKCNVLLENDAPKETMQPSTVTSMSKRDMKNVLQAPKDLVKKEEI